MKYQIKKRITDEIMYEGEANSFVEFVEKNKANLSNADLSNADLSNADLSNADLYKANLYNANLYNANLSDAYLYNANLYNAKIKITQKEDLLKALRIEVLE